MVQFESMIVNIHSEIRGGILIIHDWDGRDDYENGKAQALAELGFYAMAGSTIN